MASLTSLGVLILLAVEGITCQSLTGNINMTTPGGPQLLATPVTSPRLSGQGVVDTVINMIRQSCVFPEDNLFLRRLAKLETDDGNDPSTYHLSGYYGGIWRVDEAMFHDTQLNTGDLPAQHQAIRNAFGINWQAVRWQELEKPLYSALAAALYSNSRGPIPVSTEKQGSFVHNRYHAADTAFNYTRIIQNIRESCDNKQNIDVVFLLDSTSMNDDFLRMRNFLVDVVSYPFSMRSGTIRFAVYQAGLSNTIQSIAMTGDQSTLLAHMHGLVQYDSYSSSNLNIGRAVLDVVRGSFSSSGALTAKMIILLTTKAPSDSQQVVSAGQEALSRGVSVMSMGIGAYANNTWQLQDLVTTPRCQHQVSVDDIRDLTFFTQLIQRAICEEPMIATGMVRCQVNQCRNIAFATHSRHTTLKVELTCGDAVVYASTRITDPSDDFTDHKSLATSSAEKYVTVDDNVRKFLYAAVAQTSYSPTNCVATITALNGLQTGIPNCEGTDWKYPTNNPCLTSSTIRRFAYEPNKGMFIQCDLLNQPYLTKCPPGAPYYDRDCRTCVGGPSSPGGCHTTVTPNTPYCGLNSNPCTPDNILAGNFYFACPDNETHYLQCNSWGHAFIMSCRPNEVWRQHALTCEFEMGQYNPCGASGKRFFPYPFDPHFYIDCGADNVPLIRPCLGELVWIEALDSCGYSSGGPAGTTPPSYIYTNPPIIVTQPHFTVRPSSNPYTPQPGTNLLSSGYASPCTRENVAAIKLYWPYPGEPHEYIQCDLAGNAYLKYCQTGFTFDEFSDTCVNGPVHPEGNNPIG